METRPHFVCPKNHLRWETPQPLQITVQPTNQQLIVPGIYLSPQGEATVTPAATQSLIDLAIYIEENSPHPVDVEHVLAALIVASREGMLPTDSSLRVENQELLSILIPRVDQIFKSTGGNITGDD